MNFTELAIKGVFAVDNFMAKDNRGIFIKTFQKELFKQIDFNSSFAESYYSSSEKNVIRGMHFQLPPYDHDKLVYVTYGEIMDVVLDLRLQSATYGKSITLELKAFGRSIFIPKGCAHGFLTLSNLATVVYNVTSVYNQQADTGILWNSFGLDWGVDKPIISERDSLFESFSGLISVF